MQEKDNKRANPAMGCNGCNGKSMLSTLRELGLNEAVTFPVERMSSVKTICTNFGLQWGKQFSTKTNREARTITVTRVR